MLVTVCPTSCICSIRRTDESGAVATKLTTQDKESWTLSTLMPSYIVRLELHLLRDKSLSLLGRIQLRLSNFDVI